MICSSQPRNKFQLRSCTAMLCIGLLLLTAQNSAVACKWCPPDAGPTILRQLDAANAGVLAELIQRADPNAKNPSSEYRVVAVLKGSLADPGMEFTVPLNVESPVGSVHLFFSENSANSWKDPLGISSNASRFLERAAQLPDQGEDPRSDSRIQRLEFMLPYLASPDRQIALAAHGEFSAAPYSVIKELKMQLNHRQLVSWIQSPTTFTPNRRHLFTLLGVCGNRYDYFLVAEALDDRLASGETVDLEAIISTLLLLGGKQAFQQVELSLFEREISLSAQRAAVNALRFHAEQDTAIKKQRVIQIYRQLLLDPKTADYVLGDLARWEDWESLEQVLVLWETRCENRWLRYPILEYLKACPLPEAKQALSMEFVAGKN